LRNRIRIVFGSWILIQISIQKLRWLKIEPCTLTMEVWRLTMEPWRVYRQVIADSQYLEEEQYRIRIRICIEVKNWIRIRIK
jgi:hypothetical protein